MSDPGDRTVALSALLVRLTDRVLAGESVDIADVVSDHPGFADDIRSAWPRIVELVAAFEEESESGGGDGSVAPRGYRVVSPLRAGGQGQIVEVEHETTGRRAAFKSMKQGGGDSFREALAYDRLRDENHAAIVRVESVSGRGILMELLTGPDLGDLVDLEARPGDSVVRRLAERLEGRLTSYRRIAAAFAEFARGIAALHDNGILHRDLKPQNVKVEPGRGLVLFDLGLARIERLETISDAKTVLGTIPYLAPEALPDVEGDFDERTDVYGVGATLYSVLTNRLPHTGEDAIACLLSVRSRKPQPVQAFNPAVPAGLAHIVECAMARRPGNRYQSALELAQDLDRFAAQKKPLAEIGREERRRRRRQLRMALAVGVVLLLLSSWGTWRLVTARFERRRESVEAARAARVESLLEEAGARREEGRAPVALSLAREARELAVGPEEEFRAMRLLGSVLNAMGRTREATVGLTNVMENGATGDLRNRARIALATIHSDVGDYETAYRLLVGRESRLPREGRTLLVEAVLRMGRSGQARQLYEADGDTEALAILDRFVLQRRLPLPGVFHLTTVSDDEGRARLVASTRDGGLSRLSDENGGRFEPVPVTAPAVFHPWIEGTGHPREVVVAGNDPDGGGRIVIVDALTGKEKWFWDGVRTRPQYVATDLDGDGHREHSVYFRSMNRGFEFLSGPGDPPPPALGDLDEFNRSGSDVRASLVVPDPAGGPPALYMGTGPWGQAGVGFSLSAYRWSKEKGIERFARKRVGEVFDLWMADLDGDGSDELHTIIACWPTRGQGLVYGEFSAPGIYRVDLVNLDVEPVHEFGWSPAYFGEGGEVRQVYPVWYADHGTRFPLGDGRDGIVYTCMLARAGKPMRHFVEILAEGASGVRRHILPTRSIPDLSIAVGDFLPEAPGQELAVSQGDEVRIFGARDGVPSPPSPDSSRVSLADDLAGGFPMAGWEIREPRNYRIPPDGEGVHFVASHGRDDRLVRPVEYDGRGFRYRARFRIREMDWAGNLHFGLFQPTPDRKRSSNHLCLSLSRNSYTARDLQIECYGENLVQFRHPLEAPGSYRLEWGKLLELVVEYAPDPPSLLVSCRDLDAAGEEFLHRVDRRLPAALPPGRYEFGMRGQCQQSANRTTTRGELHQLELILFGAEARFLAPEESPTPRALRAVREAHYALLGGNEALARSRFREAVDSAAELTPLLVGPFAESAAPLALLALDCVAENRRPGLRRDLLGFATSATWAMHDPALAEAIFAATGCSEEEREMRVRALARLGRTGEACQLLGPEPEDTVREAGDAAARMALAGACVRRLRPAAAERLLEPLLDSPPSLRAELDAYLLGARVSLMLGREEEARRRIGHLRSLPGFTEEEMMDAPGLRRFVREDR